MVVVPEPKGSTMFRTAILTVAAALAFTGTAVAAAPLTQSTADAAAARALDRFIGTWNAEEGDVGDATGYALDSCEIDGRRAYCPFTIQYADGDDCDGEVVVQRGRRGRLAASLDLFICDSDSDDLG